MKFSLLLILSFCTFTIDGGLGDCAKYCMKSDQIIENYGQDVLGKEFCSCKRKQTKGE